jgi:hypothetical protein
MPSLLHPFEARRSRRELKAARRAADRELLHTSLPSLRLAWREAELTAPKNRVSLGRSVRSLVRAADPRYLPNALPVNRGAVRAESPRLLAVATRLLDLESPVTARGVLLTERLIVDASSPLYTRERARELPQYLERTLDALEPLVVEAR